MNKLAAELTADLYEEGHAEFPPVRLNYSQGAYRQILITAVMLNPGVEGDPEAEPEPIEAIPASNDPVDGLVYLAVKTAEGQFESVTDQEGNPLGIGPGGQTMLRVPAGPQYYITKSATTYPVEVRVQGMV